MKWILNSTVNSLPTLSNLKTWCKVVSDKCKLCGWKQTLKHITSGCRKANGGQNDHRSSTITDGPSVIGRIKRLTDGEMADAFHNLFRFVHKRAKF